MHSRQSRFGGGGTTAPAPESSEARGFRTAGLLVGDDPATTEGGADGGNDDTAASPVADADSARG
jgi:hypothetical protein